MRTVVKKSEIYDRRRHVFVEWRNQIFILRLNWTTLEIDLTKDWFVGEFNWEETTRWLLQTAPRTRLFPMTADERWHHIVENHDDLAGYYDDVLITVEDPDFILRGYGGTPRGGSILG
jgi:hypothetical protein